MKAQLGATGCCFLVAVFGAVEGASWSGSRSSIVINEIMPPAPDGSGAWIEIFNPSMSAVTFPRFAIQAGEGSRQQLPEPREPSVVPRVLGGGDYLLIRFDSAAGTARYERAPDGTLELHVPGRIVETWSAAQGEVALYILDGEGREPRSQRLVDYVAWGRPGGQRGDSDREAIWPGLGFVRLNEGFGLVNPDAELPPGSSIGIHPGSRSRGPKHWVVFDPDEITPGSGNAVPRPKTFSLADAAQIGNQSVGVAWVERSGDQLYRFQLATDVGFTNIIVDEYCFLSAVRLGRIPMEGRLYYRVSALSEGMPSKFSKVHSVSIIGTDCDWPEIVSPFHQDYRKSLGAWVTNPACGDSPSCKMVSSIRFKFQRKDSKLACCLCKEDMVLRCPWNSPQPHCVRVLPFGRGNPWAICAGGYVSPHCGEKAPRPVDEGNDLAAGLRNTGEPVWEQTDQPEQVALSEIACTHGWENCVRASISMIVSAYGGACLSQDLIAYERFREVACTDDANTEFKADLGHALGVSCSDGTGGVCSEILRWALGIPRMPSTPDPSKYLFVASATPSQAPSFLTIKKWIDDDRPVMTEASFPDPQYPDDPSWNRLHMRVLAGYCTTGPYLVDAPFRTWVYIFDPLTGPRAETYDSWKKTAIGTWVASQATAYIPKSIERDPPEMWQESSSAGLTVFDATNRGSLVPECPDSSPTSDCPH